MSHHQTKEEMVQELMTPEPLEQEEEELVPRPSLSAAIDATDTLLSVIDKLGGSLAQQYEVICIMRLDLMNRQQASKVQQKISKFFKPVPSPVEKRRLIESETSTMSVASTSSACLPNLPITSSGTTTPSSVPHVTSEPSEELFAESDDE